MPQNDSWIEGVANVCVWYEEMSRPGTPYFSVWNGSALRFSYDGSSTADGVDMLQRSLGMAAEQGNSRTMTLRLHKTLDRDGFVSSRTPYYASMPFRCISVDKDSLAVYNLSGMGGMDRFSARLAAIEEKLDQPSGGIMGAIESILGNEQVQPMLAQAVIGTIMGVINRFVPGALPVQAAAAGPSMAGLPGDQVKDIDWALGVLEKADPQIDDDLVKLAELALSNPGLFNLLIQNLRTMKV